MDEWKAGYLSGPAMHLMPQTLFPRLMKLAFETGTVHYGPKESMPVCCFHNSHNLPMPHVLSFLLSSVLPHHLSRLPGARRKSSSEAGVGGKSQIFTQSYRWRETEQKTGRTVLPLAAQRFEKKVERMLSNIVSNAFISSWNYKEDVHARIASQEII